MAKAYEFKSATTQNIGTTPVDILQPAASVKAILIGFDIANITGSAIDVTYTVTKNGGSATNWGKTVEIPAGATLNVISGQKHVLEDQDKITIVSDTAASVDTILSYLEETTTP